MSVDWCLKSVRNVNTQMADYRFYPKKMVKSGQICIWTALEACCWPWRGTEPDTATLPSEFEISSERLSARESNPGHRVTSPPEEDMNSRGHRTTSTCSLSISLRFTPEDASVQPMLIPETSGATALDWFQININLNKLFILSGVSTETALCQSIVNRYG